MAHTTDAFLSAHYNDPFSARVFIERVMWRNGPVCPRCAKGDKVRRLTLNTDTRTRDDPNGTLKCYRCLYKFDVTVCSIFESCRTPLHIWLRAIVLVGNTRDMPSRELANQLGLSCFIANRMIALIVESLERGTTFKHDYSNAGRRERKQRKRCAAKVSA